MPHDGRILVVDDELSILDSCENVLRHEGYSIDSARSGQDAIEMLQQNEYDLVIADIELPEESGIDVIRWLRNSKPDTGVIATTSHPTQESIRETLKLGIVDYLPKPFTPPILINVTSSALNLIKKSVSDEETSEEEAIVAKFKALDEIIDKYRYISGALIPVLQKAQELIGYLPPSVQRRIAKGMNIPTAEVHGVVSFYSFFSMKPKGRHVVKVCLGTACYVKRADEILQKLIETLGIEVGEITEDKMFSLESVRCLGACGLAPVVVIDDDTHASVNPVKTAEMLDAYE
jgi:NADH:ubiquinone oxidoreductase subunit E